MFESSAQPAPVEAAYPDAQAREILDAVPVGIIVFDQTGHPLFANRFAAAAIKAANGPARIQENPSLEQLREVMRLIDPDTGRDVPLDETPAARALGGESVSPQEYMLRRNHVAGRSWIEMSAQPMRDAGGNVIRAIVSFRGISDRKKRELAVESAEKLHAVIYEENLAGIIRVTVDGRILDCNIAMVRMLGYKSRRQLMAVRVQNIYHDSADRERMLRLLTGTRRVSEFEVCLRRRDGSRCWVILNARLLDPPTGEIGGTVVSNVIDITERRIQEETLRQSEQRFSAFMRHLPGVAFIKDLDGRYVYYNEASWSNFGKRPEEIIGKTDDEVWPGEEAGRYRQNDAGVVASMKPAEFLEPVAQSDGKHTWLIYKFPIVENGTVTLVGGVGIDVTERTILTEQLNQARKMEAIGRLAGGVAHDFNNLLTVIAGYGQLAIESVGSAPAERMITYLREILDSSRRASGLTAQLLAFSRRQVLQPKVLDLGSLLRGMERLLQRMIGEHVELVVTQSGTCQILADANQMEQAIMNLVVNARDAMPLGGVLELNCRALDPAVELAVGPDAGPFGILLEIRDNGVGMDEAVRSQMFDPFFTSKEPGKGTGLGLSTVYGVVTQAKGRIEVESTPGTGTVFSLYFPAAPRQEEASPVPVRPLSPSRGRETVLLVEDEGSVRALAETILKRLGYSVLVADCGPAALKVWEERTATIDVLLTDVIMPQMSGGELAHRLRERQPHLRVLFMSGYTDDMIASHGVLAGETQLIQKPFTADALGRKLRGVLDA